MPVATLDQLRQGGGFEVDLGDPLLQATGDRSQFGLVGHGYRWYPGRRRREKGVEAKGQHRRHVRYSAYRCR